MRAIIGATNGLPFERIYEKLSFHFINEDAKSIHALTSALFHFHRTQSGKIELQQTILGYERKKYIAECKDFLVLANCESDEIEQLANAVFEYRFCNGHFDAEIFSRIDILFKQANTSILQEIKEYEDQYPCASDFLFKLIRKLIILKKGKECALLTREQDQRLRQLSGLFAHINARIEKVKQEVGLEVIAHEEIVRYVLLLKEKDLNPFGFSQEAKNELAGLEFKIMCTKNPGLYQKINHIRRQFDIVDPCYVNAYLPDGDLERLALYMVQIDNNQKPKDALDFTGLNKKYQMLLQFRNRIQMQNIATFSADNHPSCLTIIEEKNPNAKLKS